MSSNPSWKKFGNETKAGQMLRKLYASKPKISYPKPKRKSNSVIRQKPFFVLSNPKAEDPREKKVRNFHPHSYSHLFNKIDIHTHIYA